MSSKEAAQCCFKWFNETIHKECVKCGGITNNPGDWVSGEVKDVIKLENEEFTVSFVLKFNNETFITPPLHFSNFEEMVRNYGKELKKLISARKYKKCQCL